VRRMQEASLCFWRSLLRPPQSRRHTLGRWL
ncbi:hypothetical protein AK812_SmicGene48900, partial [Symbiodinium microadriaticum]